MIKIEPANNVDIFEHRHSNNIFGDGGHRFVIFSNKVWMTTVELFQMNFVILREKTSVLQPRLNLSSQNLNNVMLPSNKSTHNSITSR